MLHGIRPHLYESIHRILHEWYDPSYWQRCRLPHVPQIIHHSIRIFSSIRSSNHPQTSKTQRCNSRGMKNVATCIFLSRRNRSCRDLQQCTTRHPNNNSLTRFTPSSTPYTHKTRKFYSNRFHTGQNWPKTFQVMGHEILLVKIFPNTKTVSFLMG